MALTSSSTFTNAQDQLMNNLVWEGSPTKARDFLEAARWLLVRRPQFSGRQNTQLNYAKLQPEIDKAAVYVARVGSTARAARSPFVRAKHR